MLILGGRPRRRPRPRLRTPGAPPLEVRADRFFLRTGNHHGEPLRSVSLRDFLSDLGRYVSSPASLTGLRALGERMSLAGPRDRTVLVEAGRRRPASLRAVTPASAPSGAAPPRCARLRYRAAVASTEGTSVRVIENRPGGPLAPPGSGQALDFNNGGQRTPSSPRREPLHARPHRGPAFPPHVDVRRTDGAPRPPEVHRLPPAPRRRSEPSAPRESPPRTPKATGARIERDEDSPIRVTVFILYPVSGGDLDDLTGTASPRASAFSSPAALISWPRASRQAPPFTPALTHEAAHVRLPAYTRTPAAYAWTTRPIALAAPIPLHHAIFRAERACRPPSAPVSRPHTAPDRARVRSPPFAKSSLI
ncbi:MAG: hypothetical protein R3F14_45575 [Polyangiaceae bacterium]